jgi:glycerol uptake facilitator protein
MQQSQCWRAYISEAVGTGMIVFFGTGVVMAAVLTGAQVGLWQVAVVWAVGVTLAIFATRATSDAHLNPAITLSCALFRGFPWRQVLPYMLAQVIGAALASAVLFALTHTLIATFEAAHHLLRGQAGSELSAMMFGEYAPNPAMAATTPALQAVTMPVGMAAEALGTGVLAFVVFTLTEPRNRGRASENLTPALIGMTVAALISLLAPISQAGLNPARDFGPRIVAFLAGWGSIAIPGPHGSAIWVYIVAPLIGGPLGAGLAHGLFASGRASHEPVAQTAHV